MRGYSHDMHTAGRDSQRESVPCVCSTSGFHTRAYRAAHAIGWPTRLVSQEPSKILKNGVSKKTDRSHFYIEAGQRLLERHDSRHLCFDWRI